LKLFDKLYEDEYKEIVAEWYIMSLAGEIKSLFINNYHQTIELNVKRMNKIYEDFPENPYIAAQYGFSLFVPITIYSEANKNRDLERSLEVLVKLLKKYPKLTFNFQMVAALANAISCLGRTSKVNQIIPLIDIAKEAYSYRNETVILPKFKTQLNHAQINESFTENYLGVLYAAGKYLGIHGKLEEMERCINEIEDLIGKLSEKLKEEQAAVAFRNAGLAYMQENTSDKIIENYNRVMSVVEKYPEQGFEREAFNLIQLAFDHFVENEDVKRAKLAVESMIEYSKKLRFREIYQRFFNMGLKVEKFCQAFDVKDLKEVWRKRHKEISDSLKTDELPRLDEETDKPKSELGWFAKILTNTYDE